MPRSLNFTTGQPLGKFDAGEGRAGGREKEGRIAENKLHSENKIGRFKSENKVITNAKRSNFRFILNLDSKTKHKTLLKN